MEWILMAAKRKRSYRKPVKSLRRKTQRKPKPKPRSALNKKQKATFFHLLSGGSLDDITE